MRSFSEIAKAVIIGHAVGDALGVPVEFKKRVELDKNPVTDMMGFGTYQVPEGSWSDDTSMVLCTLDVLKSGNIDYDKIMQNFSKWYFDAEFTPTGVTFDAGMTCVYAIYNHYMSKKPYDQCGLFDELSNGNGSLMRVHPVTLYLYSKQMSLKEKINVIHTVSALTHAHERSKIGCGIYSFVLWELIENPCKESVFIGLEKAKKFYENSPEISHYSELFDKSLASKNRDKIESSGYVVSSLVASIWCLLNSTSYNDCVLLAVNLGGDTDTIASIAGSLAGALYGYEAIDKYWLDTLISRKEIENLCDEVYKN